MKKFITCLFVATFVLSVSADLIITEVVDGTLSGGLPKAMEICNTGSTSVDLSIYEVARYSGSATSASLVEALAGSLGAKQAYTLCLASHATAFEDVWGMAPDGNNTAILGNGDDPYAIRLVSDSSLVDLYGVIGTDGSGEVWEYLDSWAKRSTTILTANDTFNSDNWTYGGANAMDGFDAAQIKAAVPGMGIYEQIPEPAIFGLIGLALFFFRRK